MKCPKCGSKEKFEVHAATILLVDGETNKEDWRIPPLFNENTVVKCCNCGTYAPLSSFGDWEDFIAKNE